MTGNTGRAQCAQSADPRNTLTFMVSPLMLPGLVLGIALLQAMREFGLRDAWWSLLLAHVVITMRFVMRTVLASLSARLRRGDGAGLTA